ncbi:hypothetical protein ACTWP6_03105 [Mycobacterium sp. 4D054]|uniref:hypothetical protein n=1 Tax=Mycobacterium sp. 4D054 TaxID=3457440 RepID=UPI003FD0AF2D
MSTADTTFTGDPPNRKNGVPNAVTVGGNPITVTVAEPGTTLRTCTSSVTWMEIPRAIPPSVVENVTALIASSYWALLATEPSRVSCTLRFL